MLATEFEATFHLSLCEGNLLAFGVKLRPGGNEHTALDQGDLDLGDFSHHHPPLRPCLHLHQAQRVNHQGTEYQHPAAHE